MTSSPKTWSPVSCRDASRPSTAARSTSGRKPAPSAPACPGRLMHEGLDVGAGDWVGLSDGLVRTVLPRRSAILRNAAGLTTTAQTLAANVDVAFAVSSLGPDLEPRRIERYLVTLWESGAAPEIVLTKADRLDDPWPLVAEVEAVALGVPVHVVSAVTGQGCDALRDADRSRRDGRPARLLRRRQVDAREPLARRGGDGDPRDARGRRRGPSHDHAPPAAHPAGRRARDRHAGPARAAALGRRLRRPRRDVRGRRGARGGLPLRRLHARARAGVRSPRRGRVRRVPGERLHSWRKLQRELRAIALRQDARLRKEETRKWKLRAREGRARARHR